MADRALIVMAAGMGSRYGGLKQIDPVGPGGEIIMDYSVYDAAAAGFDKIVFVVKKEFEDIFRDRVGKRIEKKLETVYVCQDIADLPPGFSVPEGRVKPWGTAHAVWACRNTVREPFAVINADDFYGRTAFKLLSENLSRGGEYPYSFCLVSYLLENTITENGHVSRGICEYDGSGFLTGVTERTRIERQGEDIAYFENGIWTRLDPGTRVSMNCWGFTPELFSEIDGRFSIFLKNSAGNPLKSEYYLPFVADELIQEGKARVKVLRTPDKWYGVTYKEDKQGVSDAISEMTGNGLYPRKLW